ncbi:hypothetical protein [Paenibacillus sp. Marseille-Q7038]
MAEYLPLRARLGSQEAVCGEVDSAHDPVGLSKLDSVWFPLSQ